MLLCIILQQQKKPVNKCNSTKSWMELSLVSNLDILGGEGPGAQEFYETN